MSFRFKREARALAVLGVFVPVAGFVFAVLVPQLARVAWGREEALADPPREREGGRSEREEPSLKSVVERLGHYVADYGDRLSVIVGVERYYQHVVETNASRALVSEIALMPAGRDWLAYRDVFEVDGRRIADRTDRLERLLLDSPAAAFDQARRIADASARFNLGGVQRNLNTPTMCLFSLRRENRDRFKFRRAGDGAPGGLACWRVRFEEKERPTIVRSPTGRSLPMAGYVWVNPDTGEVPRTELEMHGEVNASVTVDYERDARLAMLVPARMREIYRGRRAGERTSDASTVECDARYSDFKRFETSARLVVPK